MFLLALIQGRIVQNEEDLQLLLKISAKDESAFAQLYDRYSSIVYTFVLRIVKTAEEAEDLLQEVFLQVWNKSTLFSENKGSVYTWIITIARHRAIDQLRSKESSMRASRIEDDSALSIPTEIFMDNPLHAAISSEFDALVKGGLASLTDDQRSIIELSYYEGFTQAQIAERLNAPLGTVKTRMRQGLQKLRTHLREKLER